MLASLVCIGCLGAFGLYVRLWVSFICFCLFVVCCLFLWQEHLAAKAKDKTAEVGKQQSMEEKMQSLKNAALARHALHRRFPSATMLGMLMKKGEDGLFKAGWSKRFCVLEGRDFA